MPVFGIVTLMFSLAVMEKGKQFDDTQVGSSLSRQFTTVAKHTQPMILAMKSVMPKGMGVHQVGEQCFTHVG
jgi:hypothetical protein